MESLVFVGKIWWLFAGVLAVLAGIVGIGFSFDMAGLSARERVGFFVVAVALASVGLWAMRLLYVVGF